MLADPGSTVRMLTLREHEFATDATKYGALSSPNGHIEVEWSTDGGELHFAWREHGGPSPDQSVHSEGFGSRLIHATVTGQLEGKIVREWKPGGLSINVNVPLRALA
jgi:two-component sensor histidine kinase